MLLPKQGGPVHHRVDAGGVVLAAATDGAAGRPWLILSNSLAADHSMWDGEVAALATDYRVLRYDTRGHGSSTAAPGPYSFDDLAGDVLVLMDHFGIGRATFVGLSLGGMTGLKLALDHPQRIQRLVCCDARAEVPEVGRAFWDERVALVQAGGMAAVVEDTVERWIMPTTRTGAPEVVGAIGTMIRRTSVEGYVGCIAAIKTAAFLQRLPALALPTAYLVGEHDGGAPANTMREMASRTPGASLHVVPGAAHLPNLDAPGAFDHALHEALRETAR